MNNEVELLNPEGLILRKPLISTFLHTLHVPAVLHGQPIAIT